MRARITEELIINMDDVTTVKIMHTDDLKRPLALMFFKRNGQTDVVVEMSYEKMTYLIEYLAAWWGDPDSHKTNIDFPKIFAGIDWKTQKSGKIEIVEK